MWHEEGKASPSACGDSDKFSLRVHYHRDGTPRWGWTLHKAAAPNG
jgi:hypothetical protein